MLYVFSLFLGIILVTSCLKWFYLNREIGSRIPRTIMYLFYYPFLFTSRYFALFVSICSTIQVKSLYVLHHWLFWSGAWLSWCCVELHYGTVLRNDFWPSFPLSLVIANERNNGTPKTIPQCNSTQLRPRSHAQPLKQTRSQGAAVLSSAGQGLMSLWKRDGSIRSAFAYLEGKQKQFINLEKIYGKDERDKIKYPQCARAKNQIRSTTNKWMVSKTTWSQETWGCENQNEIIVKDYEPVVNKSLNTENAENFFKVVNAAKQ